MHQTINDRIETIVHFHHGQLKPLRFLWKNQTYPISDITTNYIKKSGGTIHQIFAVKSGGNLYQLTFNPQDYTWTLDQIYLDG